MRRLFCFMLLLVALGASAQEKGTITVSSQNNNQLRLDSAYIYADSIVIIFTFTNANPENWINIEPGTTVVTEEWSDNGYGGWNKSSKNYKMLRATGVPYAPAKRTIYGAGTKVRLSMTFPNFGKEKTFAIWECNTGGGCFNFTGVKFHL